MRRSTDRILLSHTGGLHRPAELRNAINARQLGEPFDEALSARVKAAVADVVRLQLENGVDVVNDGEYPKRGWQSAFRDHFTSIELRQPRPGEPSPGGITNRESRVFPEYFASIRGVNVGAAGPGPALAAYCVGPIEYRGLEDTQRDIAYLKAALDAHPGVEAFMAAMAPGTIEHWLRNQYYRTEEEFLFAIAEAMRVEYNAIAQAGFIVQLDDPGLPDGWGIHADMSLEEYRKFAEMRVEAMNHALRDIPEEQIRLHICWGSVHHPHSTDLPLSDIIDVMYKAKAQCYSIEAANPMHDWEWEVFKDHPLPDGKILMPGVLGHCSREFVEHPQLVAQRLVRYAEIVGRENVIAGTDCGLSRSAHESVQWAKFRAGAEGARLATRKLWGR